MSGFIDWKKAVCVKCGYGFHHVLPSIVGDSEKSFKYWVLECMCGEVYEIEYNGSFDECTFLHLQPFEGGPRIYLKDFIIKTQREAITPSQRMDILERDKFRCQLCGATAKHGSRLEIDHKIPINKGGSNDPSNLWTLCFTCNRGKRDKLLKHNPQIN
jgi:hypothetical protein